MVGSSNLDFRSFWLNAECNLLLFDDGCGEALDQAFLNDLRDSEEITETSWGHRTIRHALWDTVARSLRWAL
jgi:cardiolipin synthase